MSNCLDGVRFFFIFNCLLQIEFLSQLISEYWNRTTTITPFLQAIKHFCNFIPSNFMEGFAFLIEDTSYFSVYGLIFPLLVKMQLFSSFLFNMNSDRVFKHNQINENINNNNKKKSKYNYSFTEHIDCPSNEIDAFIVKIMYLFVVIVLFLCCSIFCQLLNKSIISV